MSRPLSRRRLLQVLAAAGITGPAAVQLVSQSRRQVTAIALKNANALIDQDFNDERLEVIRTALQRNLDQFQLVRDLEIDDAIEPALTFDAGRR
jgi:hypothetical protein